MTKEQFLIQYILNRALTSNNLNGRGAAEEAILAWRTIQSELNRNGSTK